MTFLCGVNVKGCLFSKILPLKLSPCQFLLLKQCTDTTERFAEQIVAHATY